MCPGLRHPEQAGVLATSPVLLASIVILVVNDFALKGSSAPGWLTGKLSDFAGLAALPIVLVCAAELVATRTISLRFLLAISVVVDGLFSATKCNARASHAVAQIWGVLLLHPSRPAAIVLDRTDLLAVPAAFVAPALRLWNLRKLPGKRSTRPARHSVVR
jgi:hypothetical protein